MDSIQDLVELLKEGRLSSEQVLERLASTSLTPLPRPVSTSFTESRVNMESPLGWDVQEFSVDSSDIEEPRSPPRSTPQPPSSEKPSLDEFFQRQSHWEAAKAQHSARRREMQDRLSIQECTFVPKLMKETGSEGNLMQRLTQVKDYSIYETIRANRDHARQQAELEQCTFRPKINDGQHSSTPVFAPRNLSEARARAERHFQQVCTFKPKILGVKPEMSQATFYTQEPAFERLYSKSEMQTPAHSTAPGSETYSVEEESFSQAEREESLNDFYLRQTRFLQEKQAKLQRRQTEPIHRPKICDRSAVLAKGTFEQRNQDLLKKRQEQPLLVEKASFAPTITPKGRASRQRSVEELCYGDAERKQRNLEGLRKLYEDEEARNYQQTLVSFPQSSEASSRLRLLDGSESYLERIRQAREHRAIRAENERLKREAEELAECTYAPAIREAPEFVKRVARSMAIIRAQRALDETESEKKLDWR
jgi:hypothetical protein